MTATTATIATSTMTTAPTTTSPPTTTINASTGDNGHGLEMYSHRKLLNLKP
jgi:hypothetical protein